MKVEQKIKDLQDEKKQLLANAVQMSNDDLLRLAKIEEEVEQFTLQLKDVK